MKMYKEVGAYDHFDMMLQINTLNHLTTHYKVPNLRAEGWAISTNTPSGSPYRGAWAGGSRLHDGPHARRAGPGDPPSIRSSCGGEISLRRPTCRIATA